MRSIENSRLGKEGPAEFPARPFFSNQINAKPAPTGIAEITANRKGIRENIEALAKTPDAKQLIARYIAKANEQESQLEQMEKERKTLAADKERLERELATEIKNFEVK